MLKPVLILALFTISNAIDINQLLNSMTVEEKCGQMTQVTYDVIEKKPQPTNPDETPVDINRLRIALKEKHVGSILNAPYNLAQKAETWQKIISLIQDVALNETRLKIPVIYGIDSIHGANYIQEVTLFPHSLSIAGSFNNEIAK